MLSHAKAFRCRAPFVFVLVLPLEASMMISPSIATPLMAQADVQHGGWLTNQLLQIARGGSEWVLWLLVVMLVFVVIVFIERLIFLRKVRTDTEAMRAQMTEFLRKNDVAGLLQAWENDTSMEA